MKLATASEIRAIDKRDIDQFGVPSIDLMELASECIVDETVRRFGEKRSFAVVCGPGNNGGDGLATARLLVQKYGWTGSAWLAQTSESKSSPDREENLRRAREIGIPVGEANGPDFVSALKKSDTVFDAILGTAASGAPRPVVAAAIDAINSHAKGSVIAIDLPTGVDCDTGKVETHAVRADLTVTLGFSKLGLHLQPGCEYVGELIVRDDFLPRELIDEHNSTAKLLATDPNDIRTWLPSRKPARDANKGKFASIWLLAGSVGFAGASCLCARGAARAGAGTVTLGVPKALLDIVMTRAPEVVMTKGFGENTAAQFQKSSLQEILEAVSKADTVAIGPGIGHESDDIRGFFLDFVRACGKPMVIDADALTIIATLGKDGVDAMRSRKATTILTPHPGEMGRLLGCSAQDVQNNRLESVRAAMEKYACVALLKGDRTLIAAPDGRLAVNQTGNSGMASGGMGDVLTGITATCLAQIEDPFHAAAAAAYLHGMTGDFARDGIGIAGFMADEVADKIPQAITRCLRD